MIAAKDVLDAFTYSFSPTPERLNVRGVSVEIWHDDTAENPYEWGDGMAPAIWIYGRGGFAEYGVADIEGFFRRVSDHWVSRHWRAIAKVLNLAEGPFDTECREDARDWDASLSLVRAEKFAETLAEMRSESWGRGVDYLEALADLYRMAGVPADTFQRNGYCQGDCVYGLIVHLPEWREKVGAGGDVAADMKGDADTYSAWCWGDIYGFSVGNDEDGEDLETCGGFYGFDAEYMADQIADAVNDVLNARATAEAARMEAARPDLAPA